MQVCAAIGLCDQTSGGLPGRSTSRKLQFVAEEEEPLQDNPLCPFCTAAVSYAKVTLLWSACFKGSYQASSIFNQVMQSKLKLSLISCM